MSSPSSTDRSRLAALIKKKKECDKLALEIVLKLIEPGVTKEFLIENSLKLSPRHYEDVIEERRITGLCGWSLCDEKIDINNVKMKQQFTIRGKRVLDITKRKSFCSPKCYGRSTHFGKQLATSPLWMRNKDDPGAYPHVLENDDLGLHGINVKLNGMKLDTASSSSEEEEEEQS